MDSSEATFETHSVNRHSYMSRIAAIGIGIASLIGAGANTAEASDSGKLQANQELCFDTNADQGDSVQLTITVAEPNAPGFANVYTPGASPLANSRINFAAGGAVANSTSVPAGAEGRLCAMSNVATHLIVDVDGSTDKSVFTPENPNGEADRAVDTRQGGGDVPIVEGTFTYFNPPIRMIVPDTNILGDLVEKYALFSRAELIIPSYCSLKYDTNFDGYGDKIVRFTPLSNCPL